MIKKKKIAHQQLPGRGREKGRVQISTIKFGESDGSTLYISHGGASMVYVSIKMHVILLSSFFEILFLAALGIHCFVPALSSCSRWGPLFIAVQGFHIVVASLVAEYRS